MTTLSADIDSSQTLLPISGPLTNGTFQYPLYFTVDDEAIRVVGRAHETPWLVDRAIAGTTAASHSSGATLTRYYPDAATGSTGEQTVRLLGPFPVAFNTADIATDGVLLATLNAGVWITTAWAHVTTGWSFDAPASLNIEVAPAADPGNYYYAAHYVTDPSDNINAQGDATVAVEAFTTGVDATPDRAIVGTVVSSRLTCRTSGAATVGEADIYVLIAEPAS